MEEGYGEATDCVATAPSPSQKEEGNVLVRDAGGGVATQITTCFPGKRLASFDAYSGNMLPHWTVDGVIYHICFRMFDAVPVAKLLEWEDERRQLLAMCRDGVTLTDDEVARLRYLYSETIEKYLDSGYGSCLLRGDAALGVVRQTLLRDNGRLYRLHAYGIMPNHVHVAVAFNVGDDMRKIVGAWKSISGHRINRLLGRSGELWQVDYYNHIIRTESEYRYQIGYIFGNDAVKAMRWDGEKPLCRRAGRQLDCEAKDCVATDCVATAPSPSHKVEEKVFIHDGEGAVATQT